MTNKKMQWAPLPGKHKEFDYDLTSMHQAWPKLHLGDGEEFPDHKRAEHLLKSAGKLAPKGLNANKLAEQLQQAWLAFHRGEFQQAFELAQELGPCGASVATKALGIHATYLVKKPEDKLQRFELLAEIAEQSVAALPKEANSHYRLAFGLGRYSQSISIAKALSMGLAGKVKKALDTCLKMNPKHAEAHLASCLWHAEIINKVGATLGSFTYGAKQKLAEEHIKTALKLAPNMPIVHAENAQMLLLLDEDNEQEAADAFERASLCKPMDAMNFLDAKFAKEQIS